PPRALRDLHATGYAVRFHPAGNIHGVTPDIVEEQAPADDASHHLAGVDADADLQGGGGALVETVQHFDHVERHVRRPRRMIDGRRGYAGGGHVRIPERLDLLESALVGEAVEEGEDLLEHQ